jgi:hypothetical protein
MRLSRLSTACYCSDSREIAQVMIMYKQKAKLRTYGIIFLEFSNKYYRIPVINITEICKHYWIGYADVNYKLIDKINLTIINYSNYNNNAPKNIQSWTWETMNN